LKGYKAYAAAKDLINEDDKSRLLLKVYEGILGKHGIVKTAIEQKDYRKKYEELSKIIRILEILDGSLDRSQGEIPKNLSALYTYLIKRLEQVHLNLDTRIVSECERILRTLYDGFNSAYEAERKRSNKDLSNESRSQAVV
jgi:flagellar secretion chaperone FliS